jgi:glycosyltransferase involved in cell wall biosynthesis
MKVIQVPFCFHPDPVGGTEVYVEGLARELQQLGHEIVVAAPAERSSASVVHELRVRRFRCDSSRLDLRQMYGEGDELAAAEFEQLLCEEKPDLVHLHAFTSAVSLRLVQTVKRRGCAVIFSYHTPTVTCSRGSLLRWGRTPCDGALRQRLCSGCALHGLGLNLPVAWLVGVLPPAFGAWLGRHGRQGGVWTALRMAELVALRHAAIRRFLAEADHVVAVCQWVKDLLVRNGVPASKVTLSRQGVGVRTTPSRPLDGSEAPTAQPPLRVAYFGRLEPVKGVDTLLRAIRLLPSISLSLDIFAVTQGAAGEGLLRQLRVVSGPDARVNFRPPVPAGRVQETMTAHDLIVVPSRCLETGPLVVLEAFAAGVPVLGSNLGGIAELVQDGVNGLLLGSESPSAWAAALAKCSADREFMARLRRGITPPRSMAVVAREMEAVYRENVARVSGGNAPRLEGPRESAAELQLQRDPEEKPQRRKERRDCPAVFLRALCVSAVSLRDPSGLFEPRMRLGCTVSECG